ncbi:MAG TPA: M15 family metallopeptidase [Longimicrobiales bacterium]
MIRTKSLLVALLCGAARLSAQQPAAPPEVRAEWRSLIGDYVAGDSVLYVAEVNGALKLRPGLFTSINLPDPRVQLSPRELVYTGRRYARRDAAQGTFRITPVRPVETLRSEALAARPPAQPDTLLAADLVELRSLEPTIRYDIRYATTNNFMSSVFYSQARAFLQRPAAEALVRAHRKLNELGYGLLIHDAYRPWYVTKMFWDATPDSLHDFVADPSAGSRHNRGAAVDLTLFDLKTGAVIEMPSGYDEFSPRAFPDYPGGTDRQRWHRELLRRVMEAEGFRVYSFEWWHFDYRDWRRYPVLNRRFEDL